MTTYSNASPLFPAPVPIQSSSGGETPACSFVRCLAISRSCVQKRLLICAPSATPFFTSPAALPSSLGPTISVNNGAGGQLAIPYALDLEQVEVGGRRVIQP